MNESSPVQTVSRSAVLGGDWPADVSVLISPGVGGGRRTPRGAFAQTARTVYEDLAARGVGVAYATEGQKPDSVLFLASADWWGPVLMFLGDAAASGVVGNAVYDAIKAAIARMREAHGSDVQAHLDIEEVTEATADGGQRKVKTTTLVGDGDTVLAGLAMLLGVDKDRQ